VKIRHKVLTLLLAVFVVLALVEWGVEEMLLLPRFEQIELEAAHTAMQRIRYGVNQALAGLQVSANDWGNWADTYRFMQDRNAAFAQENLSLAALKQLHLTDVAFVDVDGHVLAWRSMDAPAGAPPPAEIFPGGALPPGSPWLYNLRNVHSGQGLIATRRGVMLAAVAPVLDGFGHGPSRGMVFMGRLLTDVEVADIGARSLTSVTLEAQRRAGGGPLSIPAARGPEEDPVALSRDLTHVYHAFADVEGLPVMLLRIDVPRTITARAATTIAYARSFTFGAGIALLVFILVMLDRVVLAPLSRVTRHASDIGAGDDLTPRLGLQRQDEIGTLAGELDRMMDRLADSRRRLIDHSFESGRAELARGILHNIGNAMTPLGVRVANLQSRLHEAPAADLERALEARATEPDGTDRQADLDEFIRLAAAETAQALRRADEDVAVIARQSGLVQAALTDQLRTSRGASLIESVDLRALVDQSLEIVPDLCREHARIVLDPSLHDVGPVRVARTVLRLVLQNLVINAAEATRMAGRGPDIVRLAATVRRVDAREQLVLTCEDAGVGIPAENLERVFERGFSTKGDGGSRGIGLHWCATAMNSLGGRIWATSPGPGHGATFHVLLPLPAIIPVPAVVAA